MLGSSRSPDSAAHGLRGPLFGVGANGIAVIEDPHARSLDRVFPLPGRQASDHVLAGQQQAPEAGMPPAQVSARHTVWCCWVV